MSAVLGIPPGPGAGRARYARAMALYAAGFLSPAQLEVYRVAAADDRSPPDKVFEEHDIPLPRPGKDELAAAARIETHAAPTGSQSFRKDTR